MNKTNFIHSNDLSYDKCKKANWMITVRKANKCFLSTSKALNSHKSLGHVNNIKCMHAFMQIFSASLCGKIFKFEASKNHMCLTQG